jgi:hypothetical protein
LLWPPWISHPLIPEVGRLAECPVLKIWFFCFLLGLVCTVFKPMAWRERTFSQRFSAADLMGASSIL